MCFTFLTGCFGAINTSTRNIDLGGDYHTGRRGECCFRAACGVSTNQRVRRSCEVGGSAPPRLRGKDGGGCTHPTAESLASRYGMSDDQSAVRSGRQSDRMGSSEARTVDREITARRNSRRGGMMIKLNFCFIFCRGWWAFLLLQLHMLQALAQGRARDVFVYRNAASAFSEEGNLARVQRNPFTLSLSEVNCRICTELISSGNGRFIHTIVSLWNRDLQTVPMCVPLPFLSYLSPVPAFH